MVTKDIVSLMLSEGARALEISSLLSRRSIVLLHNVKWGGAVIVT